MSPHHDLLIRVNGPLISAGATSAARLHLESCSSTTSSAAELFGQQHAHIVQRYLSLDCDAICSAAASQLQAPFCMPASLMRYILPYGDPAQALLSMDRVLVGSQTHHCHLNHPVSMVSLSRCRPTTHTGMRLGLWWVADAQHTILTSTASRVPCPPGYILH